MSGIILGVAAAFWLTRVVGALLFEVRTTDPAVYGGVSILLLSVSLAACYLPARRGTKVNPIAALRQE
jgi:ABC-type antimicrobial peptide transport system permease subunit